MLKDTATAISAMNAPRTSTEKDNADMKTLNVNMKAVMDQDKRNEAAHGIRWAMESAKSGPFVLTVDGFSVMHGGSLDAWSEGEADYPSESPIMIAEAEWAEFNRTHPASLQDIYNPPKEHASDAITVR